MTRRRTASEAKWLLNELAAVRGELRDIDAALVRLQRRRSRLQAVEQALSQTATHLSVSVWEAQGVPVVSARTRYGRQGNLRNWLRDTLQAAYPQGVDTVTLTDSAARVFGLSFGSAHERKRFAGGSLAGALRKMLVRGEVERLHDHVGVPDMPGVWRWKVDAPTLDDLARMSAARRERESVGREAEVADGAAAGVDAERGTGDAREVAPWP